MNAYVYNVYVCVMCIYVCIYVCVKEEVCLPWKRSICDCHLTLCMCQKAISISEKKKYVSHTRNTCVIINLKEQIWLPNIKYL